MKSETLACQNCKKDFTIESEDFLFYEKVQVPSPTFCPQCRMQRRLMFRNERTLYKNKCSKCGKSVVSMFDPERKHVVYCLPCYWSDEWSPLDFGKEYDPSRPFFEQLKELLEVTPSQALGVAHTTLTNSDYINEASYCKNCYLVFNADYCENSFYGTTLSRTKDVMDALILSDSELCYETVNCEKCFNCFFSEDLVSCHDVYFSKNLVGCTNCFGSTNLRNKNYYIWNTPYSKEEYFEKLAVLKKQMADAGQLQSLLKEAESVWLKYPQKNIHGLQNVNITGEYVYNSKNSQEIYQSVGVEDSKYIQLAKDAPTKDSYDYSVWGANAERMYEVITSGINVQNIKFSSTVIMNAHDVEYSLHSYSVANIFGCVSLRKQEYCILNKQYSKEEYEKLREEIIRDMKLNPYRDSKGRVWSYGEFFPYDLCPFSYNETLAGEYLPISKADALSSGFAWREPTPSEHKITVKAGDVPKDASEVGEAVLSEVVECSVCSKAYRFISAEIGYLKRFGFPLPQTCPECRHKRRFARLNLPKLWDRNCTKCSASIRTSYAPDRPEIVYCEKCYQQEVY